MGLEDLDLKGRLEEYLPVFFELYDGKGRAWNKVSKAVYERHLNNIKKEKELNMPLIIEASFFDIITEALNGKRSARVLLEYFKQLFKDLSNNLSDEQKHMIQKNLYGVLTNLNLDYRNFIGELSVLNNLIKAGYDLLATEHRLDEQGLKKTEIDFLVCSPLDKEEILVEVVNIHLSDTNTKDSISIKNLLEGKLKPKYQDKKGDSKNTFYLIPVLWGSITELKQVIEFYEKNNFSLPNVMDSVCYMSFTKESTGDFYHRFGPVKNIMTNS